MLMKRICDQKKKKTRNPNKCITKETKKKHNNVVKWVDKVICLLK